MVFLQKEGLFPSAEENQRGADKGDGKEQKSKNQQISRHVLYGFFRKRTARGRNRSFHPMPVQPDISPGQGNKHSGRGGIYQKKLCGLNPKNAGFPHAKLPENPVILPVCVRFDLQKGEDG